MANELVREYGSDGWQTGATEGGGSQPGVGDYLSADTSSSPTIPNDGTPVRIVFDDGVVAGGAGTVTLNVGQDTITVDDDGIYSVTAYGLFDSSDPTGVRGIAVNTNGPGGVANGVPGDSLNSSGANVSSSWTGPITAGETVYVTVFVKGAADAVDLEYAFVTVARLAPMGV